jgi:LCP family protein required for cell wall assembly
MALVLLAGAGLVGLVVAYAHKYDNNVKREDVFGKLPANGSSSARARNIIKGPLTILMVGADQASGSPAVPGQPQIKSEGGQRTDTIMLLHIPADHKHAYFVSIPRDSFVNIPAHGSQWHGGKGKINAAYSIGGMPLLAETVSAFTHVTIDHTVAIDFAGFRDMVDALGGVDVTLDKASYDPHTGISFPAGKIHLNGANALHFVRQRHGLPGSDFDRMKRQQRFLYAMLRKAVATGTLTNPRRLNGFLSAATKSLTVDKQFPVVDMAFQFRSMRPNSLTFMTTPISGDGNDPTFGAYLVPDQTKDGALFTAMERDQMAPYVAANPVTTNDPLHGS